MKAGSFLFLVRGNEPGTHRLRGWDQTQGVIAPDEDREYPLDEAMRWQEARARQLVPPVFFERAARHRDGVPSAKQRAWCRYKRVIIPAAVRPGRSRPDGHLRSQSGTP